MQRNTCPNTIGVSRPTFLQDVPALLLLYPSNPGHALPAPCQTCCRHNCVLANPKKKTFQFLAPPNEGKKASHNNFSSEPHSTYFHVRATSKLSFFPLMKMLICRTLLKEHIHFFTNFKIVWENLFFYFCPYVARFSKTI